MRYNSSVPHMVEAASACEITRVPGALNGGPGAKSQWPGVVRVQFHARAKHHTRPGAVALKAALSKGRP